MIDYFIDFLVYKAFHFKFDSVLYENCPKFSTRVISTIVGHFQVF